jgi:hypothetical protein
MRLPCRRPAERFDGIWVAGACSAHPRRAQTYASRSPALLKARDALAGELSLAAGRHGHPRCAVLAGRSEPYLNLQFASRFTCGATGSGGFEALLDLRNLLAQGYRPYLLSDGSVLVFAQDQRGVSGGLAFTF